MFSVSSGYILASAATGVARVLYIPITDEDESQMKISSDEVENMSSDEVENKENKATAIWKERYHSTLSLFL